MTGTTTETVATVLVRPNLDERHAWEQAGRPHDPEPLGQCPYCHHDLMKRTLRLPGILRKVVQTFARDWDVLLTYWVCMNEGCCLMFWRHPQSSQWTPPPTDDTLEH